MTVAAHYDVNTMLSTLVPMLADTDDVELSTLVGTHIFDEKVDGYRAMAAFGPSGLSIRNRTGVDISMAMPDLELTSPGRLPTTVGDGYWILDGEIITDSGKFQDAAKRCKQTKAGMIASLAKEHPAVFVAFDVLYDPDLGDVRHLPYEQRRSLLRGMPLDEHRWRLSVASNDPGLYDVIRAQGGEGVIAKRKTSVYSQGRKKDWLKFKSKHSVTCIAMGYEPGNGARADIGAVLLCMIENGAATPVGRVGSGFTRRTIADMKIALDAGRLPVIEVECLGVTRDRRLRQPVFKGLRTDKGLHDAVITQLDELPTT